MKKFYESPIVELTVFDVEDVITTSSIDTLDSANATTVADLITEINNNTYAGVVNYAKTYSTYSW